MDVSLEKLQSYHTPSTAVDVVAESSNIQNVIDLLKMEKHVEGGYFVETDRDVQQITLEAGKFQPAQYSHNAGEKRSLSTSIFYLLTPKSSMGVFHRNASRTVHTLHHGRGIYVILHDEDNEEGRKGVRIETFRVGHDIAKGERLQWIVEGGNYKASFLIGEDEVKGDGSGLLISEVCCASIFFVGIYLRVYEANEKQTVVPGFDYNDHDFLTANGLKKLVAPEDLKHLEWLLRKDHT
jgi:predicted cupin superfamily sugar epimerase